MHQRLRASVSDDNRSRKEGTNQLVSISCGKPGAADTFGSVLPDGSKTFGGYSDYTRIQGHWAVHIPDVIPPNEAAPMLCGGITSYSPLRNNGCGPGKRVGIVGVGGLGHFGLLFAKMLGADEVVGISRTNAKKADVLKMGATRFIATDEEKDWATKHAGTLDLIVSTVSSPNMPLAEYLQLLRFRGQFIQVGAPEDKIPAFNAFALIGNEVKIGGSQTGSVADIKEMLDLVAKHKIKAWIQPRKMEEANQAVISFLRQDYTAQSADDSIDPGYGRWPCSVSLCLGQRKEWRKAIRKGI